MQKLSAVLNSKKRKVIFWALLFVLSVSLCAAVYAWQAYCFAPHADFRENLNRLMSGKADWEDPQNGYTLAVDPSAAFVGTLTGGRLAGPVEVTLVAAGYDMRIKRNGIDLAYAEWSYDKAHDRLTLRITEVYTAGRAEFSTGELVFRRRG